MEQWASTRDTKEAAAFATLGMVIKISSEVNAATNQEIVRYRISATSVDGSYKTAKLRADLKSGRLAATEPDHPLLTILRTFANRERILDCVNKGRKMHLVPVGRAKTFEYVDGDSGFPGLKGAVLPIKTPDLKMVAALATVGMRIVHVEGETGGLMFFVESVCEANGYRGADLMTRWRADPESIPWKHPFAQAMRGLFNRERALDAVKVCERKILIRKPNSNRHAILSEHSSPKAWDTVHNFFKRR